MKKYPWIRLKVQKIEDGGVSFTPPSYEVGTRFSLRAYLDKRGIWRAYSRIVSREVV
jgi:hypothetical protein